MDPFDPIVYYRDENLTEVEYPEKPVPPHLDIPADLMEEPTWTLEEWTRRGFPSNYDTAQFSPRLNAVAIREMWVAVEKVFPVSRLGKSGLQLLYDVARSGLNSKLSSYVPTTHKNFCLEDRLHKPALVVIHDWLCENFLLGPFSAPPFPDGKVNGLLLIPKNLDNVRIVTDLSSPAPNSFNDCVSDDFKTKFPLSMSSFSDVHRAISVAGSGALFCKHDLKDAYKYCKVHPSQVPAQQFSYAGLYFYDAALIFGDKSAVHQFSFMHLSMVLSLVLPYSSLLPELCLLVIDDQAMFCPQDRAQLLWQFCYRYQYVLRTAGFMLQEWTDDLLKSFGPSTRGCLFGVFIDTKACTWTFPPKKLQLLIQFLESILLKPVLTLNMLQKLMGKIQYLISLDAAFSRASAFVYHQLSDYIIAHPAWGQIPARKQPADIVLTPAATQDILKLRAMLKILQDREFPFISSLWQTQVRTLYSDASGLGGECVAALLLMSPIRAFAIPVPLTFLMSTVGHPYSVVMQYRTATLELVPVLAIILMLGPQLAHCRLEIFLDNQASVLMLRKGRSRDYCATLLVQLIHYAAALVDAVVVPTHVLRRSSLPAVIADDLTHADTASLYRLDPSALYTYETDLEPINMFFADPAPVDPAPLFDKVEAFLRKVPGLAYLNL